MAKYIIRLDDISENMDFQKFDILKRIFLKYNVKPILAVIPEDKRARIKNPKKSKDKLWTELHFAKNNNWTIAQHGYIHTIEGNGGTLKINDYGEFGGLNYKYQHTKIKKGKQILEKSGFKPAIFIAPAHSFDNNTIRALKKEKFKTISDGIGLYPFKKKGILFTPVIIWHPREFLIGTITICLHPDEMNEKEFRKLEKFIRRNKFRITDAVTVIRKFNDAGIILQAWYKCINALFNIAWQIALKANKIKK